MLHDGLYESHINSNVFLQGPANMSDYVISFHYITAKQMYELEYFIYHLRLHGLMSENQDLNRKHT